MLLRVLSADDVRQALPMTDAIEAMRGAFMALATGRAALPQRIVLRLPAHDAVSLFMPARVEGALGAKIISVFPGNARRGLPLVHGMVALLDDETGRPTALLDGGALTAIRTGAASGLATRLLADPDADRVAIIGAGAQARTQLEAVCAVRRVRAVTVYSRTEASAERFASEMAGRREVPDRVEVAESAAAAAKDADIICVATSSLEPVLMRGEAPDGAHINAVGSFTSEMIELDPELVAECRVVVDQREAALAEAGEIIAAIEAGLMKGTDLAELGDIVAGGLPQRTEIAQPTLFKSVGLAVQDMCAAAAALERARQEGLGQEVEL
ncbi:MAG: NAD(P)-binding domain-containing protein [Gemmatimonadota bacterium]